MGMMLANRGLAAGIFIGAIGVAGVLALGGGKPAQAAPPKPNIIFVMLDDVGIDQLSTFGNGGVRPPATPNMDLIAQKGVKFTNAWALPECSPSRSAFFTGRFSLRTGVDAVIAGGHLPQTYMSQFEATVPRVLAKAGYTSALIGKYHLGNDQDPAGNCAPVTRGFNVFQGSMTPGPTSVDTTAGGVDPSGSEVCGYYQQKGWGACYTAPGDSVRCGVITAANSDPGTDPARTCLQHGGIFVPRKACGVTPPTYADFSRTNAYYVWPRTNMTGPLDPLYVNPGSDCGSTIDRTYLTDAQGTDGINWWKQQTGPRMLTLSFNAIHTPYQKPPTTLVPDVPDRKSSCSNVAPPRDLLNAMIEGADVEIGRVLASLGLATMGPDGRTLQSLHLGNTLLVIIGDNGSQGAATRAPFNIQRSKGTVYQTGIWVPLIVAGPMVKSRNRSVDAMVNAVDLYQLFGDVAGIDVKSVVPPSHIIDSEPMLPYLVNPAQRDIRVTNYSQLGVGTFSPDPSVRSWPCQLGNTCNDTLIDSKALCENDNGGTWYGPGAKKQLSSCCAVNSYLGGGITLAPLHQYTIRGGRFRGVRGAFKLVENQSLDCSKPITNDSQKAFPWAEYQLGAPTQELYDITLTSPQNPKALDNAGAPNQLCAGPGTACTQLDQQALAYLNKKLKQMKNSAKAQNKCQSKGDGNMDMRVTQADIDNWKVYNGKGPSRYDINLDGVTDEKDLAIIQANLGLDCMNICQRADLNRDGKVDNADLKLLRGQSGVCADQIFCGGDLNGDGKVDATDVSTMKNAEQTCQ
jgi:arylsulfatase A-like enzyme